MNKNRNASIDAIKGLAIIAVALYHFGGGYLPYGYLGVDIFFVVGGYLLIGGLKRQFEEGRFNYWSFGFRKIVRLWPLVILSSIVSVGIGYLLMLPDDYENLAESTIASSFFANNILQCITTKNYWDVVNLYKPLMHLWYVGVLMQAYIVLPILYLGFTKLARNKESGFEIGMIAMTIVSFVFFLIPQFSTAWKFYYLPFRIFEITAGGLLVFWEPKTNAKIKTIFGLGSLVLLLALMCSRLEILSNSLMLILTVIGTMLFIASTEGMEAEGIVKGIISAGAFVGKRSYSIYIWHQVIVAFLFYSVFPKQSILSLIVFLTLTVVVSMLSYQFIEVPLGKTIGKKAKEALVIIVTLIIAICLCGVSFIIYRNAGVVRDVPELNNYKNNVHRGMHAEY